MQAVPGLPPRQQLIQAAAVQSKLHDMASLGRVHDVEVLIQAGADREKPDAFGRTPLHLAAALGHEAVVRMLARLGAKLEHKDTMGMAAMHMAANHGQCSVVAALLELRAEINDTSAGGRAPLHHAVEGLQAECCRQLVELEADAEARDDRKDTPVCLAVRFGHTIVLDALIDSRCDLHTRDEEGATPLHLASCRQRLECIEVLIRRKARVESSDNYGMTALHWAARAGECEAAARLAELKANVGCRTSVTRQTPVHLATLAEEVDMLETLVRVQAGLDGQDSRGYTALHCAVAHNRPEALVRLLSLGASRDLQTKAGDTALHLSCHQSLPSLVMQLMIGGCNVNARGRGGYTALHVCAELGAVECAKTLVAQENRSEFARSDKAQASGGKEPSEGNGQSKYIINTSMTDHQKQHPLHLAAWHGRVDLCELLVQNNAEVDPIDCENCTPLSLAVSKDHETTVKILLRLKADPLRRNLQELMPLQQACVCGSFSVAKTLTDMKMLPPIDEEPWRRPMALAKFYGHQNIVNYYFRPCPKMRLLLSMVRAVKDNVISATFSPIIAEPTVTSVKLQVAEAPPASDAPSKPVTPMRGKTLKAVDAELEDLRFTGEKLVLEKLLEEAEWVAGKTMLIPGMQPGVLHLLRLVAVNDAGTTCGDVAQVRTKGKESPRLEASPLS